MKDTKVEMLGQGTYNAVYKLSSKTTGQVIGVFKWTLKKGVDERIDESTIESEKVMMELDYIDRSVRLFNEINPDLPQKARPYTLDINNQSYEGWLSPCIYGNQASDDEIAQVLVDIYQRTQRIVVDAIGKKNVIKPVGGGKPVCIDIGQALRLDYEYGPLGKMEDKASMGDRRGSIVSVASWRAIEMSYVDYFKYYENPRKPGCNPTSVEVIKALLFIRHYKPELKNVEFLLLNPTVRKEIANAYDVDLANKATNVADVVNAAISKISIEEQKYMKAESNLLRDEVDEVDEVDVEPPNKGI